MNKTISIAVIVLVIVIGGYFIFSGGGEEGLQDPATQEQSTQRSAAQTPSLEGGESSLSETQGEVKEFVVSGVDFRFSLDKIRVSQGDTVRIVFKNDGGLHDWKIDELGVATKQISAGQEETIEFIADRVGEFEYYCSVGNHRELGMRGTFIVE